MNQEEIQKLVSASHEAKKKSYSRYSKFRVGAALMCDDGTVVKGCNVENASYGLTICAERTAIVKAVSDGYRKFKAIAIARFKLVSSTILHRSWLSRYPQLEGCMLFKELSFDFTDTSLNLRDLADSIITPCGACRQFLVEFGVDWHVYMSRPDMSYKMMKTGDLLPACFAPDSLEEERISHSA